MKNYHICIKILRFINIISSPLSMYTYYNTVFKKTIKIRSVASAPSHKICEAKKAFIKQTCEDPKKSKCKKKVSKFCPLPLANSRTCAYLRKYISTLY